MHTHMMTQMINQAVGELLKSYFTVTAFTSLHITHDRHPEANRLHGKVRKSYLTKSAKYFEIEKKDVSTKFVCL